MFRYDTHIHTAEVSPCASVPAAKMIELYLTASYDGLVVTDHYSPGICDPKTEPGLTHEAAINRFLSGYELAVQAAAGRITVLLGMELRFHGMNNDFLVYGIDRNFLLSYPDIRHMNPASFHRLAQENSLLFFAAHPFRDWMEPLLPSDIDGVEAMNGNPRHNSRNHLAAAFATQFNLLETSGSDFHELGDQATGGLLTKTKVNNNHDLLETLQNRSASLIAKS